MSIRFDIDFAKIERHKLTLAFLQRFAGEALKQAQALTQQRISGGTGAYERGFRVELIPGSPPQVRLENNAKHAIYIEEGTVPHVIKPKDAKSLRWWSPQPATPALAKKGKKPSTRKLSGSEPVFAQKVNHPGTEAQHILRDAVAAAGDRLNET